MASERLLCPCCGAPADPAAERCAYCRAPRAPSAPDQVVALAPEQVSRLAGSIAARLEKGPASASDRVAEGVCFLRLGQYAFARPAFEAAVRADPRCADAYAYLALCGLEARHPRTLGLRTAREIARHAQTARALAPRHPYATAVLALVVREYFENGGVRHDGPGADALCRELAPLLTSEIRAALAPHVRTTDRLLQATLAPEETHP